MKFLSERTLETMKKWRFSVFNGKSATNDHIGHPIDQYSDGHCGGPGSLTEQLGGDHPRYTARSNSEEHHERKRRDDTQVRHPVYHFLHIVEELLISGVSDSIHNPQDFNRQSPYGDVYKYE